MGGAAILTAERAQGHMVHWLHIANVWSWICHKFALSPSHTIEGGISLVGVLGVSTQALLILVGCYVENRLFEDLTRALGALIATLFVLSTIFVEPRRKADQSGAGRLMPSTHLWLAIVLGVWYLLYCPIQPAPHGFILEPVVAAFGGFIIQLYLSVRNFPVTTRLGILAVISTLHIVRPMFSIGWREPVIIIAGGLTGFFCGAAIHIDAMKTRRLLELAEANRLAVANRHADSKLNHVIKGQCGGAAALVSMLLQAIPAELVLDCSLDLKPHEMLQQIRGMLMQAVEWCHKREAFVQLEEGSYVSAKTEVMLRTELKRMLGSRAEVDAVECVMVDATVLELVVQEAAANVSKHAPPREPFQVEAVLQKNPERVAEWLHLKITNRNRPGVPCLSAAECLSVFEKGFHKPTGSVSSGNGLGLSSIKLAVKSIGGSVWLEANQHHTMLHAVLPATRCTAGTSAPTSDTRDDSPEVQPHLTTLRESGVPVATPALRQIVVHPSVEENRAAVKMEHEPHPNAPSTVPPPVCIGIDDSAMLRRVQATLFRFFLKADTERSASVGSCAREVEAFVDIVMGKRTSSLEPADLPPADIAVLDENIDVELDDTTLEVKGSHLALDLRKRGFTGVVCILSGSSLEVLQGLARLPGVDFVFDKGQDARSIGKELLAAHEAAFRRSRQHRAVSTGHGRDLERA